MPSFFLKDAATPDTSPLPPPAPLPTTRRGAGSPPPQAGRAHGRRYPAAKSADLDRKSTRLNSSHSQISYAVFFFKRRGHPRHLPSPPTRPSPDHTTGRRPPASASGSRTRSPIPSGQKRRS